MRTVLTGETGFCYGVRRAVDTALSYTGQKGVYTYGEIIHNDEVVQELVCAGIAAVHELSEITDPVNAKVVIRSHGAEKAVFDKLESMGAQVIDATCPSVTRVHDIARTASAQGRACIIIGEKHHPEVAGTAGWTRNGYVVNSADDVAALPPLEGPAVVAQTTAPRDVWDELTSLISAKSDITEPVFHDTICQTTQNRQRRARELAQQSDACIVVGDKKSSNTNKLYRVCKKYCPKTYYIENIDELLLELLPIDGIISVIAGASTPERLIREVIEHMSDMEDVLTVTNEENAVADATAQNVETVAQVATEEPVAAEVPAADETVISEAVPAAAAEETSEPAAEEEAKQDAPAEEENEFLSGLDDSLVRIKRGQIVRGKVVLLTDDEACVSVGYKADGLITRTELTAEGDVSPKDILNIGDEIDVEVLTLNDGQGNVLLSKKRVDAKAKWIEFCNNREEDAIYDCKVTGVVKGGLIGTTEGYETFIPASQVALRFVEDLNQFNGQILPVTIKECDKRQKRIVASHRDVLMKEQAAREAQIWASFCKGDVFRGIVKRLTDFGAFVDIGGIDGLLHIRDISWVNIKHPSDVLSEGQEIEVVILNTIPEKKRISLGYKQLQPKPWDVVPEKYFVGETITGKVVRIVPFGAFVELEPGIDGLIHISQVAGRRIERVEDELTVGDEVTVQIMEVNPQKRKISLSRRALMAKEEKPEVEQKNSAAEEEIRYEIPAVEELGVTIGDFFPKTDDNE